jgi:hypothetical protein
MVSISVNCAIIFFTSKSVSSFIDPTFSYSTQLLLIVMTEHLIIGFKLFLSLAIRDKPDWVHKEE